nr:MAG TPA: hypothetical protein [Caudoviricetes sp.]
MWYNRERADLRRAQSYTRADATRCAVSVLYLTNTHMMLSNIPR